MKETAFARRESKTSSLWGEGFAFAVICSFYDAIAYDECREPSADRVVDKERGNFCDYFTAFGGERYAVSNADEDQARDVV